MRSDLFLLTEKFLLVLVIEFMKHLPEPLTKNTPAREALTYSRVHVGHSHYCMIGMVFAFVFRFLLKFIPIVRRIANL